MGDYILRCLSGGEIIPENYSLSCKSHSGFIRSEYAAKQITFRENEPGIFHYVDWLPVHSSLPTKTEPVTFKSEELCSELGHHNLWITFTGWYPERGCFAKTGSFKELEALPTLIRVRENGGGTLVVASAGNTGRAFAQMGADFGMPVLLVVPDSAADNIWTVSNEVPKSVTLVTVNGDYSDAIAAADEICRYPGYISEGGGKNVARRDGMATVMLSAAFTLGKLPDHYFQGVGSGTGGVAAWEASIRLLADGRFGSRLPKLHLAQNLPFVPMVNAWKRRSNIIEKEDMPENSALAVQEVYASVLTNRFPAYSVKGGVYDALWSCGGEMYSISNNEAKSASKLFADAENGIDLDPAAAVALAALQKALSDGSIKKDETVILNCTGGGYSRIAYDCHTEKIPVSQKIQPGETIGL